METLSAIIPGMSRLEWFGGKLERQPTKWSKQPQPMADQIEYRTPFDDRLKITRVAEPGTKSTVVYELYLECSMKPIRVRSARDRGTLLQREGLPTLRHIRATGNRLRVR